VSVLDRPLLAWHLQMLADHPDVFVAVGYQAAAVIEFVRSIRPNAMFAFNHDYLSTGTAASLVRAAVGAPGDVLSLDGDLLIHPDDFRSFLEHEESAIGVEEPLSSDAWLTDTKIIDGREVVTDFHMGGEGWEWTGMVRLPSELLAQARADGWAQTHVLDLLRHYLPLPTRKIRTREIDTPDDYDRAAHWLAQFVRIEHPYPPALNKHANTHFYDLSTRTQA